MGKKNIDLLSLEINKKNDILAKLSDAFQHINNKMQEADKNIQFNV